ncbi:hypothetical protein Tco_1121694 [Tanacetum coccineum]|uniref:Uncharacterized protein n=1 Tax=Tanacetum coccineum TaxID=301880 RepID=A0ABQ5J253_9ASTR
MEYCENEDDSFTNFKTEYPAIVFDDTLTSDAALSCEPTVSPLNENKIDFRISFDESDDEDYMVIFDEKSFSYKIISIDNLKMDLENENDEVNMPSSPEPTISHSDDLDFFKDFENEFPVITYNVDLTSKLTKPSISFQHIEKFDLNNETSLSKYDEEERTVLYFNDSFPLNIVFPNNLKSKKDIDDSEIDVTQSSGRNAINIDTKWSNKLLKTGHGTRLRGTSWISCIPMSRGLRRYRIEDDYTGDEGQELFTSHAWRRLFEIRAPLVRKFILEFRSTCRMSDTDIVHFGVGLHTDEEMAEDGFGAYCLDNPTRRLCHRMISCSISSKGHAPEKVTGVNQFYLRIMDRGTANVPYLLAQYLFRHAEGRKSGARLSGGYFIGRLATYFGLLNISERIGDTWAWVAPGPERQPNAATGTLRASKDALVVNEGAQADLAPV